MITFLYQPYATYTIPKLTLKGPLGEVVFDEKEAGKIHTQIMLKPAGEERQGFLQELYRSRTGK